MAKKKAKAKKEQSIKPKLKKIEAANNFNYQTGFWKKNIWAIPIFFVLSFIIYFQCIPFDYVLDDQIVVSKNNYTQEGLSGLWKIFSNESFEGYFSEQKNLLQGGRYRPLSIMMFAVEHAISPNNFRLNHIINILLYSMCCLLLFRVLSQFLKNKSNRWFLSIAFITSLIYLVHPVHVEAVANIKGRDEILAFIFGLATIYYSIQYLKYRQVLGMLMIGLCYYLGLLAKENVLTFLAVVPLSLFLFTKKKQKDIWKITILLFVITVLYLIQRYAVIGFLFSEKSYTDVMNNPFVGTTFWEKYATISFTQLKYLGLSIFPYPLTHDYYPYHIPILSFANPWVLLSVFLHLGLMFWAFSIRKTKPIYTWCIFFYLFTVSIVSNMFVNVGTFMNERFIFISSAGISLALVYFLMNDLATKFKLNQKLVLGLAGLIFVLYGWRSIDRVPDWESALTLNKSAVKVSKNSARANSFMATALFNEALEIDDKATALPLFQQAQVYANKAVNIMPDYKNGNLMKAGAAAEVHKRNGDLNALFKNFKEVGSVRPTIDFIEEYCDYLADRGKQTEVKDFYYDLGYNELSKNRRNYKWAIHYLTKAYTLDASDQRIRQALGESYRFSGNEAKAKQFE